MPLKRQSAAGATAARFMLETDTCSCMMKRSNPWCSNGSKPCRSATSACQSSRRRNCYGVEVSPRRSQDAAALAAFLP
jgi:hypothetical protein